MHCLVFSTHVRRLSLTLNNLSDAKIQKQLNKATITHTPALHYRSEAKRQKPPGRRASPKIFQLAGPGAFCLCEAAGCLRSSQGGPSQARKILPLTKTDGEQHRQCRSEKHSGVNVSAYADVPFACEPYVHYGPHMKPKQSYG